MGRGFFPWFLPAFNLGCAWGIWRKRHLVQFFHHYNLFYWSLPVAVFVNFLAYIKGILFFVTKFSSSTHSRNRKLRHRIENWPVTRSGRQVQQSLCAIFWPTVDLGRHWNCALGLVTYSGEQLFSSWQAGWVLSRAAGGSPWFFHFLFSRSCLLVRPFHLLFMESMISEVIGLLHPGSQKWGLWSCLQGTGRRKKTKRLSKIPIFERIGLKRNTFIN